MQLLICDKCNAPTSESVTHRRRNRGALGARAPQDFEINKEVPVPSKCRAPKFAMLPRSLKNTRSQDQLTYIHYERSENDKLSTEFFPVLQLYFLLHPKIIILYHFGYENNNNNVLRAFSPTSKRQLTLTYTIFWFTGYMVHKEQKQIH